MSTHTTQQAAMMDPTHTNSLSLLLHIHVHVCEDNTSQESHWKFIQNPKWKRSLYIILNSRCVVRSNTLMWQQRVRWVSETECLWTTMSDTHTHTQWHTQWDGEWWRCPSRAREVWQRPQHTDVWWHILTLTSTSAAALQTDEAELQIKCSDWHKQESLVNHLIRVIRGKHNLQQQTLHLLSVMWRNPSPAAAPVDSDTAAALLC